MEVCHHGLVAYPYSQDLRLMWRYQDLLIGIARDDTEVLMAAATYLMQSRNVLGEVDG